MQTQTVVTQHPVLAFIFGLNYRNNARTINSTPMSTDCAYQYPDEPSKIAFGGSEYVSEYCQRIVSGDAPVNALIYALPTLLEALKPRLHTDREAVKLALKQVLFHATMTDMERERIAKAVGTICRM